MFNSKTVLRLVSFGISLNENKLEYTITYAILEITYLLGQICPGPGFESYITRYIEAHAKGVSGSLFLVIVSICGFIGPRSGSNISFGLFWTTSQAIAWIILGLINKLIMQLIIYIVI